MSSGTLSPASGRAGHSQRLQAPSPAGSARRSRGAPPAGRPASTACPPPPAPPVAGAYPPGYLCRLPFYLVYFIALVVQYLVVPLCRLFGKDLQASRPGGSCRGIPRQRLPATHTREPLRPWSAFGGARRWRPRRLPSRLPLRARPLQSDFTPFRVTLTASNRTFSCAAAEHDFGYRPKVGDAPAPDARPAPVKTCHVLLCAASPAAEPDSCIARHASPPMNSMR